MNDELKRDIKELFLKIFGPRVAKVVDEFDDPKRYPEEFTKECFFFLSKLMGKEKALNLLLPILKKHFKKKVTFFLTEE